MLYNYVQCLSLKEKGLCISEISRSMNVSRYVISEIITVCEENHITSEIARTMDIHEIYDLIHPNSKDKEDVYVMPDFKYIHTELAKKGVTMYLLWIEYRSAGHPENAKLYQYSRFCELYSVWAENKKLTMRLKHKPGDAMEIDWTGLKPSYLDLETNESREASVFVAVLPYSMDFYWEIFRDEKEEAVIVAVIHSFEYFGGVPRLVKPDNMKTAVAKNKRFHINLNKALENLANYYHTAIVPTRVRHPKDKSHAEGTVKIVENGLIAPLRNNEPTDFETLKAKMEEKAEELRAKIVEVLGTTRREYYEREEKPYMKPLPETRYEPVLFAQATIGSDYCADVGNNKYSVPYKYSGKKVDVMIYPEKLEFYFEFQLIATHKRYHEIRRFPEIKMEHMPPSHRAYLDYNKEGFLKYASEVGPVTHELFDILFRGCVEPEQVYPVCASLKALGEKYGTEKLERACNQAKIQGKATDFDLIDLYTKKPNKIPERKKHEGATFENQHAAKGFTRGETEFGSDLK